MGNKVIAVGLGHTGTRSLNQALIMLGIPAKHWPHDRETYHELANGVYRLSILEKYDAVTLAPFYAQAGPRISRQQIYPHCTALAAG